MRDLHELRKMREARRHGHVLARSFPGPAAPIPLFVTGAQGIDDRVWQAELPGERLRQLGMHGDHPVYLAVARYHELEPNPEAVQRWLAGAEERHAGGGPAQAESVLELGGLHGDVVAKPLGLLVRIRMAPDIDQESRVVDGRPRLLVESELFCQPQRDQALAEHVLHGLPEPQIDPQRQCGEELGQTNVPDRRPTR